jgi:hypothetical protein
VQPPAGRSTQGAKAWGFLVEDGKAQDRLSAGDGRGQGRVVAEPEIVSKPDEGGGGQAITPKAEIVELGAYPA